jgi:hypothetical protein
MSIPYWWDALLLTVAAWRLFHLLAFDDILDKPRRHVTRLSPNWKNEGDATGEHYRAALANFIVCPYCLGFWVAAAVWGLWLAFPTETEFAAVPLAFNAGLIGAQRLLSSE